MRKNKTFCMCNKQFCMRLLSFVVIQSMKISQWLWAEAEGKKVLILN